MEFTNQYLTYKEYRLLGGKLQEMPFNLLENDARRTINERTQSRLINLTGYSIDVKTCVFRMIDVLETYQKLESQDKSIASTNTDGYSETYRKLENSDIVSKNKTLENIMRRYLCDVAVDGVPVLFLGAGKC